MIETALFATAVVFAVVNGTNAGGALLSTGLTLRSIRPVVGLVVLMVAVFAAPLLVGTQVATTLAQRLVTLDGQSGQLALMIAVISCSVVTGVLSRRGLPNSLTLGLVGAIVGVGFGAGLPVQWGMIGAVLGAAALAPVVGIAGAYLLSVIMGWLVRTQDTGRLIRRWHVVAFTLQCVAYGANDGQKMLAVFAVVAGTMNSGVEAVWWQLGLIALLFGLGAAVGVRRLAATIGNGVLPMRPEDAVTAETTTAGVVLGSAVLGAPVGLAQTLSGSLIGCGIRHGYRRVRWRQATKILMAWISALPTTFGLAAALGAAAALFGAL